MRPLHRLFIGLATLHVVLVATVYVLASTHEPDGSTMWIILAYGIAVAVPLHWGAIDYAFRKATEDRKPF